MEDKKTIQIRIDRKIHKKLKYQSIEEEKTITQMATEMILYCLANNIIINDAISRSEV
jgi:hypothetical protein